MLIPVILSGGSGTRLWPLSRELYPKQLLPLVGERTMLQETAARVAGVPGAAAPIVVCNESHRFMVAEQLRESDAAPQAILLEPVGRNTAPAVAVAALVALELNPSRRAGDPDPTLLVLPADHVIRDVAAFQSAVAAGRAAADAGKLVTFGVVPDRAETGYGYIRREAGQGPAYPVAEFVEKPDAATAARYLASGDYYWNSGMFLFRARAFLDELRAHAPEILAACERAVAAAKRDLDFTRLPVDEFAACPSDSIDYAVMEKTALAAVVPVACGWSDVGSWHAVWELSAKDEQGNAAQGAAVFEDSRNCNVSTDRALVALEGVDNLVVVATQDAVLVSRQKDANGLKRLVARLKIVAPEMTEHHLKVHRPWGSYQSVDNGDRHQVKRIIVKPGGRLSLQKHHHRAEHWIVVRGAARVTVNETIKTVHENESIYIPIGAVHRLENPGKIQLELIEVQTGSYLGEDDIVRIEDDYQRN